MKNNLSSKYFNKGNLLKRSVLDILKKQYAGSFFGIAWAIIFPLLQSGVYALLFTVIFRIQTKDSQNLVTHF